MKQWKAYLFSHKIGKAEWIVLAVYTILLIVIGSFHEFHFDELQSWQIAKSASYHDMLFYVPHYEGHPPLWHLILSIFAKTGCDFQWALHAVNIAFCVAAMCILLFRSPFPKIVRCVLPFSYFLCYQYGVLSRPYSMMMLAVLLAAMGYRERNVHPWRYILPLMLLCLTTAYGILTAGGLCIVWTVEIVQELLKTKKLPEFLRSARFFSLLSILALALLLFWMLLPADDVYFEGMLEEPTILDHLKNLGNIMFWLIIPFDTWFGSQINSDASFMTNSGIIVEAIIGVPVFVLFCIFLKKNRCLMTFLVPYLFVSGFMVLRYFAAYHLGMIAMLFVFAAWIVTEQQTAFQPIFKKLSETTVLIRRLATAVIVGACVVPEAYTVLACVHEIEYEYAPKSYVDFIKENHLEDRKIMMQWSVRYDIGDDKAVFTAAAHRLPMVHPPVKYHLTDISGTAVDVIAYFDRNILMNFNTDCPDDLYMHYRWKQDEAETLAKWRSQGLPEFIIGCPPLDEVYSEEELEGVRYVCIDEFETHTIFKNGYSMGGNMIFIREDLLDEYPQFTVIP